MDLSYAELNKEKKAVKNELKYYDEYFTQCFQEQPSRHQKEPMRPLYVYYKGLK